MRSADITVLAALTLTVAPVAVIALAQDTALAADCPDGATLCGQIKPMNAEAVQQSPGGVVAVTRQDGTLEIMLEAKGLSPGTHLAHLHGFQNASPQLATCPGPEADTNGDGIIDLMETAKDAGTTLIPLTDDPTSLAIKAEGYPSAGQDGRASYSHTVDMAALEKALRGKYGTPPALETRVLFIHGVAEGTTLPDSVQSLEGVPAEVTLPIACAELRKPEG